jgi:hypothetical protein
MNEITKPEGVSEFGSLARLDTVSRIYCGMRVPLHRIQRRADGSPDYRQAEVSKGAAARFVREVVAEHFPDGFIILSGMGGWQDVHSGAPVSEPCMVVEVVHAAGDVRVAEVAKTWKRAFYQDAVMIVSAPVKADFV